MACRFNLTRPCGNCPFRRDGIKLATLDRALEIAETEGEFPCHKTFNEDGGKGPGGRSSMCAGFLLYRERQGSPNQTMRVAERLGLYDPGRLDWAQEDQLVDIPEQMVED